MDKLRKLTNKKISDYFVAIIIVFICFTWFWNIKEKCFIMGDDIRLLNFFKTNNLFKALFTNDFGIYRPVSYFLLGIIVSICNTNIICYLVINIFLYSLIMVSIYYVLSKIIGQEKFNLAAIGTIISIFNIYSYYGVTQILGFMELLCALLCIWYFYFLYKFIETQNVKYYYISILMYALVLLSHERYLSLLGVYIVFDLFVINTKIYEKLKMLFLSMIPAGFFLFMKVVVLQVPVMVGTGQIKMEFDIKNTLKNIVQSIFSIFGINLNFGQEYLYGIDFGQLPLMLRGLIIFLLVFEIIVFVIYFWQFIIKSKEKNDLKVFSVFLFLEGACIVCYSISARIELREYLTPYLLLNIYIVYCISKIDWKYTLKNIFITIMIICSILHGYIFYTNVDMLFFFRSMKIAKSAYQNIFEQNENFMDYKYYIENNGELTWAILSTDERDMMYLYKNNSMEHETFDNINNYKEQIDAEIVSGEKIKIMYLDNSLNVKLVDVTESLNNYEQLIVR